MELMQCSEFLATIERRLEDQIKRGRHAGHSLSPDRLNQAADPKKWSAAQIFEHMMLGNAPYLQTIQKGIEAANRGAEVEVRHTLVGKLIIGAAGPKGNAPPAKPMIPGPGPFTPDIVD